LALLVAGLIFVAADVGDQVTGGDTFLTSGPLDENAHLMTTLIVLTAIGVLVFDRFLISALIASVVIDLDHIPRLLGTDWFTAGTPRPYTHSLLTIALVLVAASRWRRHRTVLLGVAVGLSIHFWRDTAEPGSGVSLLWPLSRHSFGTSHASYLILMGLAFAFALWRLLRSEYAPRASVRGARA
jgi:hypothetical protein